MKPQERKSKEMIKISADIKDPQKLLLLDDQ